MIESAFETQRNVKWAFTTRRVRRNDAAALSTIDAPIDATGGAPLRAGDVIRAEVVEIGQHSGLQLKTGRRATLYAGDEIALCLGARYAPDQFECAAELDGEFAHLVAAGGVAGLVTRQHGRMKTPTLLRVRGRLVNADGRPLNIADYALQPATEEASAATQRPPVIAVFGASMNSGKTTAAASLIHGLTKAGFRVGACKATGTGACGDMNTYRDAGAACQLDFTDMGFVSTFGASIEELRSISRALVGHLARRGADVIVMEIADGVLQKETAALMADPVFLDTVDGVLFAAPDALAVANGVQRLSAAGHSVLGVSGLVTRSPMACEEAGAIMDAPILTRAALCEAKVAARIAAVAAAGDTAGDRVQAGAMKTGGVRVAA